MAQKTQDLETIFAEMEELGLDKPWTHEPDVYNDYTERVGIAGEVLDAEDDLGAWDD